MIAERGAAVALCLLPTFAITSLTHEVYFYCALAALLIAWCYVESKRRQTTSTAMPSSVDMTVWCFHDYRIDTRGAEARADFDLTLRTAALYLVLALYAFLGTGNIASLNSFDPSFIRLFVTQFKPWLMMALLIYKCLTPFITLSLTLHTVRVLRGQYAGTLTQLMLVLLMMSDVLTMVVLENCIKRDTLPLLQICFFRLRDSGSWLDIGESISHYILSMCVTLALVVLYYVTSALCTLRWENITKVIEWRQRQRSANTLDAL